MPLEQNLSSEALAGPDAVSGAAPLSNAVKSLAACLERFTMFCPNVKSCGILHVRGHSHATPLVWARSRHSTSGRQR